MKRRAEMLMQDFNEIFTNYDQLVVAVDRAVAAIEGDDTFTNEEIEAMFLMDSDGRGEGQL
jgi:hypothetical protein